MLLAGDGETGRAQDATDAEAHALVAEAAQEGRSEEVTKAIVNASKVFLIATFLVIPGLMLVLASVVMALEASGLDKTVPGKTARFVVIVGGFAAALGFTLWRRAAIFDLFSTILRGVAGSKLGLPFPIVSDFEPEPTRAELVSRRAGCAVGVVPAVLLVAATGNLMHVFWAPVFGVAGRILAEKLSALRQRTGGRQ